MAALPPRAGFSTVIGYVAQQQPVHRPAVRRSALTVVDRRRGGASPQRSESERRLEAGREADEAVRAVVQHAATGTQRV
jgi:hypothetical protein